MTLSSYLPQDRLRALARGQSLPDRTSGAAILADISGFTPLTEVFEHTLGRRQGAEELTRHLDAVFSALVAAVEQYGGSVVSFAGDAIICWFDDADGESAPRAVRSAFAMQTAMAAFDSIPLPDGRTGALTLKTAVAHGPVRRFAVGDPAIGLLDTLAGATVSRTAAAEHLANPGEVLVDQATAQALGEALAIAEWRTDPTSGGRFAVAAAFAEVAPPESVPAAHETPADDELQPWVPAAIRVRGQVGQSAFLNEFRPCVALFVRFEGIDYDHDGAQDALGDFVANLQIVAGKHEGALIGLTIGDKGSYAHLNFGALAVHEDDALRAVRAALDIVAGTDLPLQIGIAQGLLRVGAYGSETRQAFGSLGDGVNLAARLMTTAGAGEILVSGHVHKATRTAFAFEPHSPLPVKGKAEPLPVFSVTGERRQRAVRLQEPTYALPMVGRERELAIIEEKLALAAEGQGQVIGIVAEAGLGKSRLVAEVIRNARRRGFVGFGGACQSDGVQAPYLVWKSIWQAFFDVDRDMPERRLLRRLEGVIEDLAPSRIEALPLLNVVLDLNLPENEFTQHLEPMVRQSALHALLVDCLRASAAEESTLVVIEDLHWIDALSHDLLEQLIKASASSEVCFVMAYRPPDLPRLQQPQIEALPQFTKVELHELTKAEAESAVRAKLAQLYPARGGTLPEGLVDALMARAQGNPFYLEELLNYVRDRGLDPTDLNRIELPDSLHTLILSRIDQLGEREKTTLRVASVVGRMFQAQWLNGYYPELGPFPLVKAALDLLDRLDITPLDSPEPELAYLFRHIVTHEVTYESLPFATRANLHEKLARYLEGTGASVDTIAFHYRNSGNKDKQREYLRKAAEAAQKRFANDAALEYYGQLLPLLQAANEQAEIFLQRGRVLELIGRWDEAEADCREVLELVSDDLAMKADAQFELGKLKRMRGNYLDALDLLAQVKKTREISKDSSGLAQVLTEIGTLLWFKGEYARARGPLREGLRLARELGDTATTAKALNVLGMVAERQSDYDEARALYEESLELWRQADDKRGQAATLGNAGTVAYLQGDYSASSALYQEGLALEQVTGDKSGFAAALSNVGLVAFAQGDYSRARALWEETLTLQRELDHKYGMAASFCNLGSATLYQGDWAAARASFEESLKLCNEMDEQQLKGYALLGLGLVGLAEHSTEARQHILASLRLRQETGEQLAQTSSLIGLAGLALHEGKPQRAARLLGAVEAALKALGAPVEGEIRFFHTRTLAGAREAAGKLAFQSEQQEGAKLSLEEAVRYALEEE